MNNTLKLGTIVVMLMTIGGSLFNTQESSVDFGLVELGNEAYRDSLFWVIGPSEGLVRKGMGVDVDSRRSLYQRVAPELNRATPKNIDRLFAGALTEAKTRSVFNDTLLYVFIDRIASSSNKRQARNRATAAIKSSEKGSPAAIAGQLTLDLIAYSEAGDHPITPEALKRTMMGVAIGATFGGESKKVDASAGSVLGGLLGATSSFRDLSMD